MPYTKQTHAFKTVGECKLNADIYHANSAEKKPGILWIHGGGLIFGSRNMIPTEQVKFYIDAGYAVISVDYRLAPETTLKNIIQDVKDAYAWLVKTGTKLFNIDPEQLTIVGHSAGGYLALCAGGSVAPKPKALVSFYGYGDVTEDWCHQPSVHYNQTGPVSAETAYKGVNHSIISGSEFTGLTDKRWLFYLYCRQQGLWAKEITGVTDIEKNNDLYSFCPLFNLTESHPPVLLLHGGQDTDVPCESSKKIKAELDKNNSVSQLVILENLGHAFDTLPDTSRESAPSGFSHPLVTKAFEQVKHFMQKSSDS